MRVAALLALSGAAACARDTGVEPGPMELYAARLQAGCDAGDRTACQQMAYTAGLPQLERCQRWRDRRKMAYATRGRGEDGAPGGEVRAVGTGARLRGRRTALDSISD